LYSPRTFGDARTFYRLPDRALRRQLPSLARSRAGPHPPDRRRNSVARVRSVDFKPSFAHIRSVAT
jgi:hypothetical protein